jgi:hypothetical protein
MAGLLASFYKSTVLADYNLYLINEDTNEPQDDSMPSESRGPTPVHGMVLMATSEHFKVRINNPFGAPTVKDAGKKRMFIKVAAFHARSQTLLKSLQSQM